ncbi:MAG: hypothetical protein FWD17_13770, partial [Polyangiaceae bacterium]|nr:hypothetical protein [Polyangiaceae bacterium]
KLGLDRVTSTADLVARARALGGNGLAEPDAHALEEELRRLARFETAHMHAGASAWRPSGAEVHATATRVRRLVAAVAAAPHGKVETPP